MSSAAASRVPIARWWEIPVAVLLAVIAAVVGGAEPRLLPLLYVAAVTPALCSVDVLERRLPNRLVLPGYPVALGGIAAHWLSTGELPVIALIAGAAYFGLLLLLGVAGGMGMGDVKLAGVLGLAAGLLDPAAALASPVAAFVLGGVAGVVALRRGRGASIPFGPFMLAGFWIAAVLAAWPGSDLGVFAA